MNGIIQQIGHAYAYLAKNMHNQTPSRSSEDEIYLQAMATAAICGIVLGMGVKKCMSACAKPSQIPVDTPKLFWKELQQHQRPPLPVGPVIIMGKVRENGIRR